MIKSSILKWVAAIKNSGELRPCFRDCYTKTNGLLVQIAKLHFLFSSDINIILSVLDFFEKHQKLLCFLCCPQGSKTFDLKLKETMSQETSPVLKSIS